MVSIILSTIIYNKIRTIYYSEGIFLRRKREEGRGKRNELSQEKVENFLTAVYMYSPPYSH